MNFIAVNWQKGSDVYNYLTARGRVLAVAEQVAKFVDFMSKRAWMSLGKLTIVGHSLGAHVAGISKSHVYFFSSPINMREKLPFFHSFCSRKKSDTWKDWQNHWP